MYIPRNNIADVLVGLLFGIVGIIFIILNISRVPFIIAFVLATPLEDNYFLAVSLAGGDLIDGLLGSPLSIILFLILVVSIAGHRTLKSLKDPEMQIDET
jgi:putative tricarboxylic transport membrane protein